ncbi:MAG TPA: MerR family transcriptional regulator [Steroidobacteraceae bacterium]|jgi:DNA-binding transcriptional MerR regulator|nr:MerR family transcriptional regulator [Steroidobacteraceae bacterium]
MAKKKQNKASIGAAECARQTGLTVRALRVYERYGLITPKRSARGWRIYDQNDLARLTAIVALKRLGMTLSQIKIALMSKAPQLGSVLRAQLESSRARKDSTDRLIKLIERALSRLRNSEELSISDIGSLAVEHPGYWATNTPRRAEVSVNTVKMKSYESSQWQFRLTIPERWNSFPPVSSNSPAEVIRFQSTENGNHVLIIFRHPNDPSRSRDHWSTYVQEQLAKGGFGNFVKGTATVGSRTALTLDFDRPQGAATWSCRHYFVVAGTLSYTLGFGTTDKAAMSDLFDRVARSFEIHDIEAAADG